MSLEKCKRKLDPEFNEVLSGEKEVEVNEVSNK